MDINDKVAVITGGASGLGEATTERLHAMGAKVAIFDLNDELGNAVAQRLGDGVSYYNVNVTDEESVAAALGSVMQAHGAIHICCNYAGIGTPGRTLGRDGPLPLEYFKRAPFKILLRGHGGEIAKAALAYPVMATPEIRACRSAPEVLAEIFEITNNLI